MLSKCSHCALAIRLYILRFHHLSHSRLARQHVQLATWAQDASGHLANSPGVRSTMASPQAAITWSRPAWKSFSWPCTYLLGYELGTYLVHRYKHSQANSTGPIDQAEWADAHASGHRNSLPPESQRPTTAIYFCLRWHLLCHKDPLELKPTCSEREILDPTSSRIINIAHPDTSLGICYNVKPITYLHSSYLACPSLTQESLCNRPTSSPFIRPP